MGLAENILSQFEKLEKGQVLENVRKEAFHTFQQLGIPSVRHEEWKYTSIKTKLPETLQLAEKSFPLIDKSKFNTFADVKGSKLVFINGNFVKELSTIMEEDGVVVGNLQTHYAKHKEVIEKNYGKLVKSYEEHFSALNTAFAMDSAFVYIKKNVSAKHPVFIIHLSYSGETFIQSRDLVIAEEGSRMNIVIDFQNLGPAAFYNHVTEVYVAQNANVDIAKLQTETKDTTAVHTLEAELMRDSKFSCTTVSFEGNLIRNNSNVRLSGENAEAHLNGLYYAKGKSLIDNHILVDHRVPHCESFQLYKGIVDDEATGVFNGKIFVRQDAQKTNSYQSSKAILLSNEASVNSKPQLEIFADDVKCSHGAAIGQLSENEIFYLRARGIEEQHARSMLTFAFANAIINKIAIAEVRQYMEDKLRTRLNLEL